MSDNSHAQAHDQAAIQHAHHFWSGFTKATTFTVLGVVAVLVLMAVFLV